MKKLLIGTLFATLLLSGCSFNSEANACKKTGGNWKEMFGCGDSCGYIRNPEVIDCSGSSMNSCDCGPDKCWNGTMCEPN